VYEVGRKNWGLGSQNYGERDWGFIWLGVLKVTKTLIYTLGKKKMFRKSGREIQKSNPSDSEKEMFEGTSNEGGRTSKKGRGGHPRWKKEKGGGKKNSILSIPVRD